MLVIKYDPEKGRPVRDKEISFLLKDGFMRSTLPATTGKKSHYLHVASILVVQQALNEIKANKLPYDKVRFEYYNFPCPHSKDGRFTKLPVKHAMRSMENSKVPTFSDD